MAIAVSKMTESDAKEVFEIENSLLGNCSLQTIVSTLNSENLNYYVLKNDEEIIGFMELSIIPPECELYDIAIKNEFQGKGYSKILMDNLIQICKQNLCETIFLEVNSINYKAINLYQKYGFQSYTIRKNYYGNNDAILMKLDLN